MFDILKWSLFKFIVFYDPTKLLLFYWFNEGEIYLVLAILKLLLILESADFRF